MLGPDAWIVVPGVRAPGDAPDDQARTIPVADAVGRGATHLVVGRPITRAADPRGVYQRLMESHEGVADSGGARGQPGRTGQRAGPRLARGGGRARAPGLARPQRASGCGAKR